MLGEIIQPPLFKTGPLSDSGLIELRKLGLNRVAFDVTKTGLSQGDPDVLKYIFCGMHNLEISPEITSLSTSAEISSKFFATGKLKKGNLHPNLPRDFLKLVRCMDICSYKDPKFASLASKLKDGECFDSSPGRQMERFGFLTQSVGKEFVDSFHTKYKFSDKENSYLRDFYDEENKKFYVDGIYRKFEFLNKEVDKFLRIIL